MGSKINGVILRNLFLTCLQCKYKVQYSLEILMFCNLNTIIPTFFFEENVPTLLRHTQILYTHLVTAVDIVLRKGYEQVQIIVVCGLKIAVWSVTQDI